MASGFGGALADLDDLEEDGTSATGDFDGGLVEVGDLSGEGIAALVGEVCFPDGEAAAIE